METATLYAALGPGAAKTCALQHSVKERRGGDLSTGRLFHIAPPSEISSAKPAVGNRVIGRAFG